jgi:hypothetical protein
LNELPYKKQLLPSDLQANSRGKLVYNRFRDKHSSIIINKLGLSMNNKNNDIYLIFETERELYGYHERREISK